MLFLALREINYEIVKTGMDLVRDSASHNEHSVTVAIVLTF